VSLVTLIRRVLGLPPVQVQGPTTDGNGAEIEVARRQLAEMRARTERIKAEAEAQMTGSTGRFRR
jgi:hypothetical protein